MNKLISIGGLLMVLMNVFMIAAGPVWSQAGSLDKMAFDKGFNVVLSVYSGRPNPQWRINLSDKSYTEMDSLMRSFKTSKEPLFKYSEWNAIGYASFWIYPIGMDGLPFAVHIWRDFAYIEQDKKGSVLYALGATKLYDLLVSQAEERGQEKFFVNYHKYREGQKK